MKKIPVVGFVSLGCPKALVDTERIITELRARGYRIGQTYKDADLVIVNTCGFVNEAIEESIEAITEALKENGRVIVCGCLGGRVEADGSNYIAKRLPKVLGVTGPDSVDQVMAMVEAHLPRPHDPWDDLVPAAGCRLTPKHYAYLKISEGCNHHCTFCIIPKLRGPYRSVPMEELIAEAKTMAEQGVKELVLVAQETTIYGIDLYGKPSLHLLLKELCKIQELYWIRILYCYPEDIYPELVQTMKEEPKVCHYLDLPIQHANDEILRRMGRRTSKQELIDKIDFLRSEMPDITLRTTLITGFPGETKEQHKELLEFINDMEFDRLGVFTYSPEEGTPVATMEHQIDEEVKLDRQAELMELQQDISAELGERRIGQELLVMIEGKVADEDAYVGRSQADAPGVDGYVFVNTPETLVSGDFVRVKITGALEYDLIGEISQ